MLVTFLGASAKPSFAMFEAIHQAAQNEALKAAAKAALSQDDHHVFATLMKFVKAADKHRNRLAHWLWAVSSAAPDGLVLIDPAANFQFLVRISEAIENGDHQNSSIDLDRSKVLVYRKSDLEEVAKEYDEISEWLRIFKGHLSPYSHPALGAQYPMLLRAPRFRKALLQSRGEGPK